MTSSQPDRGGTGRRLRRYAPFLAVAAGIAVLIAVLPSRAPEKERPDAPSVGVGANADGDRSHCTDDGRQIDGLTGWGVACVPKFEGDNGGVTADGVTAETVEVVLFEALPSEEADAILGVEAEQRARREKAIVAYVDFVNSHFEMYGRQIELTRVEGDCPTTPPDYDRCLAAAQEVVDRRPFAVIWITGLYAEVFDVFANAGIPSFGGEWFDGATYSDQRPYRWDLFMDGTQTAEAVADFYCKNMAGKPADHAGELVHPAIGGRDTIRHMGITTNEQPASIANANHLRDLVSECTDGEDVPFVLGYSPDFENAAAQAQAGLARMISEKVTTTVCLCDGVAAAFGTPLLTASDFFPEHLISGMGFVDNDTLGRLADPQQWAHAFGPSQLWDGPRIDDSDATRVWQMEGNEGLPCPPGDCSLEWSYIALVALGVQQAGPQLTPATLEEGFFAMDQPEPAPGVASTDFGPDDYGLLSSVRAVYWDPEATSAGDGKPGAWVALNDGERYDRGEIPADLLDAIPVR